MAHESHYEEDTIISQFWAWVILLGFSASIIGWMMWLMIIIPDVPRHWDFGALPDTPGSSAYATLEPSQPDKAVQQLPTLPEAQPLESGPSFKPKSTPWQGNHP